MLQPTAEHLAIGEHEDQADPVRQGGLGGKARSARAGRTRQRAAPAVVAEIKHLDKLPNDPWNNPYQYLNPGIKGDIDVLSFGADGQAGGEGKDADVGSWQ